MAKWIATITNAGTALLNSQVSGADLVIVGAVSSSTETAAEELAKLTEMTNIKQDLTLGSVTVDSNNSTFSIPITLFNDNLEVSYALKQIGIYAQDPTDTENKILFAVAQIDVARVINLPADAPGYKLEIDLNFQNTNNSNVVIQVTDESLRKRVDMLETDMFTKMDKVNPTGNGIVNFGDNNSFGTSADYYYKGLTQTIKDYVVEKGLLTAEQFSKVITDEPRYEASTSNLYTYYSLHHNYTSYHSAIKQAVQGLIDDNVKFRIRTKTYGILETKITNYGWNSNGTSLFYLLVYFDPTSENLTSTSLYNDLGSAYFGSYIDSVNPIQNTGGTLSLVHGENCKVYDNYNSVMGYSNIAKTSQNIFGFYNVEKEGSSLFGGQIGNTIFTVGNGTSEDSRSNAFRITDKGYLYAKSATVSTGADYAEFFEWADGNVDNEDRIGYFVTFDNGKMIRIATKEDDYILGIVSANPCIIGNGDEEWQGRYVLDDFGRYILETVDCTESVINSETGEKEEVIVKKAKWKENPDYNSELEYIQRLDRQEWSAIGMMGVLSVRDDGTCQVNGYCTVSDGGIATSCERGVNTYRVLERVTENIVKVLFK